MSDELNAKRESLMELWRSLIPNFCPSEFQFNLWLQIHDFNAGIIGWGIKELAFKFHRRRGHMDGDYMVRFVSSVINRKKSCSQWSGKTQSATDAISSASAPGLSSAA